MRFKTVMILLIVAAMLVLSGCAKENKYVNAGVNMSTAGMSLYLTDVANGFLNVSSYVFFAESSEEALDKIRLEKQGIDITYLPAKDLGMIKKDDKLTVVFPDCFETSGELKGVWVANNRWLENAPNYSYRFILGLAKAAGYRAGHMNMSYSDALESVKGVRDIDWEKYPETMQYCAVYATSNKEELADEAFAGYDAKTMLSMFEGFSAGTGKGYDLCKRAYEKYCGADARSFEELFDMNLAVKSLKESMEAD